MTTASRDSVACYCDELAQDGRTCDVCKLRRFGEAYGASAARMTRIIERAVQEHAGVPIARIHTERAKGAFYFAGQWQQRPAPAEGVPMYPNPTVAAYGVLGELWKQLEREGWRTKSWPEHQKTTASQVCGRLPFKVVDQLRSAGVDLYKPRPNKRGKAQRGKR